MKRILIVSLVVVGLMGRMEAQAPNPAPKSGSLSGGSPAPSVFEELPKFDLQFSGGPPKRLVEIINNELGGSLNVIVPDEFKETQLPALALRSVNVAQVFEALQRASQRSTGDQASQSSRGFDSITASEPGEGGSKGLQKQFDEQTSAVQKAQAKVDELRLKSGGFDPGDSSIQSTPEGESLRSLQRDKTQYALNYIQASTLLDKLRRLDHGELRKTLPTAAPDAALDKDLAALSEAELRLSALNSDLSPQHPDVIRAKSIITVLNRQIEDRIDGIMQGLESLLATKKAAVEQMTTKVEEAKAKEEERAKYDNPYFAAKRDLETQQRIRETIYMRILQESVDSKIPGSKIAEGYGFRTIGLITPNSIWYFYANKPPTSQISRTCRYFQVAPYLTQYKIEDITTAIRTGWEMLDTNNQPTLKFHEDTKLLVAVGEPEKLGFIEDLLQELERSMAASALPGREIKVKEKPNR